jgi:hypothetical protein
MTATIHAVITAETGIMTDMIGMIGMIDTNILVQS